MDRVWFLTSSFYGTRLPGDGRGFVGRVRDLRPGDPPGPARVEHDQPGTLCDANLTGLRRASAELLKGPPVYLTGPQAEVLVEQFRETARFRGWDLLAAAVMCDHVHLVVGVSGDPDPWKVLGDLKAYGSRALTGRFGKPAGGTWWTSRGSTRRLADAAALREVVDYVLYRQPGPLVTWAPDPRPLPLGERGRVSAP